MQASGRDRDDVAVYVEHLGRQLQKMPVTVRQIVQHQINMAVYKGKSSVWEEEDVAVPSPTK